MPSACHYSESIPCVSCSGRKSKTNKVVKEINNNACLKKLTLLPGQSLKLSNTKPVFEILLRYTENKDWKQSLCQVIPKRKGIIPLSCRPDENDSDNPGVSGTPSATTKGQCSEELGKLNSKISGENSLSDDESTKNLKLNNVDI